MRARHVLDRRGSLTVTIGAACLSCASFVACAPPRIGALPPCRPGDACAPATPPETEEEQWAHVESALAEGVRSVRAACGSELEARYDKETWNDVPYPRAPSVLSVRASELPVEQAMTELSDVCTVGVESDKAAVRAIKEVVIRYAAGGGTAELGADGALIIDIDPMADGDPYRLRKHFGWKWR